MMSRVLLVLAALSSAAGQFQFNYSNTHGDHMVLQHGVAATLWGFGQRFSVLSIQLLSDVGNFSVPGVVGSDGLWRVKLPPQPASLTPYTIFATSVSTGENFTLSDVLFGDVIVCGGQSNMALGVGSVLNSSGIIADAAQRPYIRILSPQYSAQNISQLQFVLEYAINWTSVADPAHAGIVSGFSAVCYQTAVALADALNGTTPFGLIDTSVGGTSITLWLPPSQTSTCPLPYLPPGPPWTLSCWYNGMFAPLSVGPTDTKLILWDQGEQEAGFRSYYECAFPVLIQSWRAALQNPTAPFLFVQLPAYVRANDTAVAEIRQGQLSGLTQPGVAVAVTADDGDPLSPYTTIHNRNKTVVAQRLAAAALVLAYGQSGLPYRSPRYAGAKAVTNGATATVSVSVASDALNGGLVWRAPAADSNSTICPTENGIGMQSCDWFAVQTSDGAWYNATAAVSSDGSGLVLTATLNATSAGLPVLATRNGWNDWPVVNVYDQAGFPLTPWTPQNVTSAVVMQ